MLDPLVELLNHPGAHRLALTLLHTLWQAALIALVLHWTVLRWLPAKAFAARYRATLLALIVVVISGVVTWSVLGWQQTLEIAERSDVSVPQVLVSPAHDETAIASLSASAPESLPVASRASTPAETGVSAASEQASANGLFADWTRWLLVLWTLGVAVMLGRAIYALLHVHVGLLRTATDADAPTVQLVNQLRGQLGIRRPIRVLASDRLLSPAVIGAIWPTLLMPAAAMTGLSCEQLRLVIAHELAHVRRHDYVVNLLQLLLEAVLFFNPAVWWLSRQLRIEREACCDAMAAAILGDEHRPTMAHALLSFVERGRPASAPVAQAFFGSERANPVMDRIRRLLLPDDRPAVRLPWYTLLGLLMLNVVLLGGLHTAADITVTRIAQALTPHERLERLEEVHQTNTPAIEDREYGPEDRLTVAGTVRTADEQPLPERVQVTVYSQRPGSGAVHAASLTNGTFEHSHVNYGQIQVSAWAEGYAPALVGPFLPEPGGRIDGIEIVFDRGFTSRVQLEGNEGQALPNVEIDYSYWHGNRSIRRGTTMTDDAGIAAFEHAVDWTCRMEVRADGYEFERRTFELSPEDTFTWQLRPARPASGIVVDQRTGEPIAGSALYLLRRTNHAPVMNDPRPSHGRRNEPLATTDEQGRFELNSLRVDSEYEFWVEAEGHGVRITPDIAAGREDITIELGPELYIEGRIVAGLDELRIQGGARNHPHFGKRVFQWRNPLRVGDVIHSSSFQAVVEERDGVGHFRITNLVPGKVTLNPPGQQIELDLQEPVEDLEIDLTEVAPVQAEAQPPRRRMVLDLVVNEGDPKPRGTVEIQSHLAGHSVLTETLNLAEGRAEMDVYVGGTTTVKPKETIGYWFGQTHVRDVEPGEDPLVVEIETVPAGMIVGRVLGPDGESLDRRQSLSIHVAEEPPLPEKHFGGLGLAHRFHAGPPDGRFAITPIPLEGTYAIGFWRDWTYVMSDPIRLDAANPHGRIELTVPDGEDVEVLVLCPDGQPLAGVEVGLGYRSPYGSHSRSSVPRTDGEGRLVFASVNPDVPGQYQLHVPSQRNYEAAVAPVPFDGQPVILRLEAGRSGY